MGSLLLKDATIIGAQKILKGDLLIENDTIVKIGGIIEKEGACELDCHDLIVFPGLIDAHVHFRQPGTASKGTIYSESRAAVLGGVTTCFDMPNTNPPTTCMAEVQRKKDIAGKDSLVNYAFYLGASGDNLDEIKNADITEIAGIKVYMGSTTGSLLVDKEDLLLKTFAASPCIITAHCEDNDIINQKIKEAVDYYGDEVPFYLHGMLRGREACKKAAALAINLALETGKKLHIMHISTKDEVTLLEALATDTLLKRQISAEACIAHLYFSETDYFHLKGFLKCNPAVKTEMDRRSLIQAVKKGILSTIGTDHAPHEKEAKQEPYTKTASGLPSVQYGLLALLELWKRRELTLEEIVNATSRNPAIRFNLSDRGVIAEGFKADLAIVNPAQNHLVTEDDIASVCKWSPFEGTCFTSSVVHTIVNGSLTVKEGRICSTTPGCPIKFARS